MEVEIVKPPQKFKSEVWKFFGFLKGSEEKKVVCIKCKAIMKYSGNTTNMSYHLRRHHPELGNAVFSQGKGSASATASETVKSEISQPSTSAALVQTPIYAAFGQKLNRNSAKAQAITSSITSFIIECMVPFSIVDSNGFRNVIKAAEPRYTVPERHYFSEQAIPEMYEEVKRSVIKCILQSTRVAITTDSWTSRATQSYVTVTAHYIDLNWEMCSSVLQTRLLSESHTGVNIGKVLTESATEWGFADRHPAVVSDNASNMDVAVKECGFSPHIKCFAHTLNLASQRALDVSQVSRLLGRVRRIVTFFHKSTSAFSILQEKQTLLNIPKHKLIQDVATRWNSSYDMLDRFLEQQPAIVAALMHKDLRKREKDLFTIKEDDVTTAEDIVAVLKPVKSATTVLCSEKSPTLSVVYPLFTQIMRNMSADNNDKPLIRDLKKAFSNDFQKR